MDNKPKEVLDPTVKCEFIGGYPNFTLKYSEEKPSYLSVYCKQKQRGGWWGLNEERRESRLILEYIKANQMLPSSHL